MQQIFMSSFCLFTIMIFFKVAVACNEFSCGDNGLAVSLPFPRGDDEQGIVLVKFFVKHIDYISQRIQLRSADTCLLLTGLDNSMDMPSSPFYSDIDAGTVNYTLFSCPVQRNVPLYAALVPCHGNYTAYAIESSFGLGYTPALESCTKMFDVLSLPSVDPYNDYNQYHLRWSTPNCSECKAMGKECRLKNNGIHSEIECFHSRKPRKPTRKPRKPRKPTRKPRKPTRKPSVTPKLVASGSTLGSFLILLLAVAAYRFYTWNRNETDHQLKVEKFLEDYKALKPSRYSYADIKRITNGFKDKLGEGAYGTVFKGNLSTELFVAVKVLNSSKGDGEEFINEVGAIGQIHHVNVVRLVGFCADGFKRALVYEYFHNGSLQEFISSADNKNNFLGWEKLQHISLGIAKGIEYLHEGCDQRILHFDIKPHNVLLDQNFTPKISDFGLAKLCSKDQSIVSMTTARGTMGYMAPEVFSRNFGNVSYKSDVYSFGMLLLEIVGGRKNIGSTMDTASDVYYPKWIYNLLEEEGEDLRVRVEEEGSGAGIAKELAIVGLWCIQWHPVDRPSMKVVVQMLEGREKLTLPPNPFGSTNSTRATASQQPPLGRLNLELDTIVELE